MAKRLSTLACIGLVAALGSVARADDVAQPWGTIHGNIGGTAASSHSSMIFSPDWANGAEVAWSLDLAALGVTRAGFWSSIVFDEEGNLYWKTAATDTPNTNARIVSFTPGGTLRWKANDGAGGDHYLAWSSTDSVVVGGGGSGGRVYALGNNTTTGLVAAYSKATGAVQWVTNLPGSNFTIPDDGVTNAGRRRITPVLYNGKLFIIGSFKSSAPAEKVKFYQVDSASGALDWSADIPCGPPAGIWIGYRGQAAFVPDAFGAGLHGFYFNGDSGSGTDSKGEIYGIKVNTTTNTATRQWGSDGGKVTRSHVIHVPLGAAGPADDRVCTATWSDYGDGSEFYCWYLDGTGKTATNNVPNTGHGFYDVTSLDIDGNDVLGGGFSGQVARYGDIDVGTNGPAINVYYQFPDWWGELRTLGGLYQDPSGNSIMVSGTNSRGNCTAYPPGSGGECLGPGHEARIFAGDMTNAPELPNCAAVDDGAIYVDNFTITAGNDELNQTLVLSPSGFESYTVGDVPTNGTNPGGTNPVGFTWRSEWTSSNGLPQIINDPTGSGSGKVLKLDAFQGCYDYQGIFADLPSDLTNPVVIISWDQYREDSWDNVYMDEDPTREAWYALQWDVPASFTARDFENPITPVPVVPTQWQHVEYKFDFVLSEVTVTVDDVSTNALLDPFAEPVPETSVGGWAWYIEGGEWSQAPGVAIADPVFAYNTGILNDHAYTVRGGPLLGPVTAPRDAEQHIYYFANPGDRTTVGDYTLYGPLVALRALAQIIDCNNNGISDSQDISGGTSQDCNGNNIPDECDIAAGTSVDNAGPGGGGPDGIPDDCQDLTGPVVTAASSWKQHGMAAGDNILVDMDSADSNGLSMSGGGVLSFLSESGEEYSHVLLGGGGWYYGPNVELATLGFESVSIAGGGTLAFDARYFNAASNTHPYEDAPIFVVLYTLDANGLVVGSRDFSIVYATQAPWNDPPAPTWTHVTVDLALDPYTDALDFDPTNVGRVRFYGTDWFGEGEDYVDLKNLSFVTNAYPNRQPIDVLPVTGVESRQNGPTELLVTFDEAVHGAGGVSVDDVTVSSGTVSNVSTNGKKLTVLMSGASNDAPLTVSFPGIVDQLGNFAPDPVTFGVLLGDSDGDMDVDLYDWALFQACFTGAGGGPIGPACVREDYLPSGDVQLSDHVLFAPAMTGPR